MSINTYDLALQIKEAFRWDVELKDLIQELISGPYDIKLHTKIENVLIVVREINHAQWDLQKALEELDRLNSEIKLLESK